MKALGLIGNPEDTHRLIDRLRVETDVEAQSWGIAALLGNVCDRSLGELCAEARLEKSSALVLAARLYAPKTWINAHAEDIRISLHDDELALKWAIFLIGYNKAPEDLFDRRYSNAVLLGELNTHDSPYVSEYSIWALWERPDYNASYLKIRLDQASSRPDNVRKWLYQLAAQSPDIIGLTPDALADLRRDTSAPAREGLALGVRDLDAGLFGREVIEWYAREPNKSVKENLLASMAAQSQESSDYQEAVASKFKKEQADSPLRRRLLAASIGTPLYGELKRIDQEDDFARQGLLFGGVNNFLIGDFNVSAPTFNAGRDIKANNIVAGDMINSANAAIQRMDRDGADWQDFLIKVMEMLRQSQGTEDQKAEVAKAVKEMAEDPNEETKKGIVARLAGYAKKAALVGTAIADVDKLIEAARHLPF
jgi:hypothetical protein